MADFFWQRMEKDQGGDLADIVRASGRTGGASSADLPITDWQLPEPPSIFPPPTQAPADHELAGAFGNLRDPLLHELPSTTAFFDPPDPAVMEADASGSGCSLLAQKILSEEMKRPCNIFSRMLQISPARASPLSPRAIKPSPIGTAAGSGAGSCYALDHGMQIPSPRTPGSKRRKGQAKKVLCVPAPAAASSRPSGEVVPSDLWAWRKYGQKPIKGSPYPRGYYRCSSSKGCSARKQVERSRNDPNMLVITYTSEHNHPWPTQRNALAGSTRSQPIKCGSSTPKSSTHNQMQSTSLKEETKDMMISTSALIVKEEAGEIEKATDVADHIEFDHLFHQNYKPMIPESNQPDDFFADLAELEPDPMSLIFAEGFMEDKSDEEKEKKALDPFDMFDWVAGSSTGEAKKGL